MANQPEKTSKFKPAKPHMALVPSSPGNSLAAVSAEARRTMIAETAYYIAEQRGFSSGRDVEDWLLAEKQVDAKLSA